MREARRHIRLVQAGQLPSRGCMGACSHGRARCARGWRGRVLHAPHARCMRRALGCARAHSAHGVCVRVSTPSLFQDVSSPGCLQNQQMPSGWIRIFLPIGSGGSSADMVIWGQDGGLGCGEGGVDEGLAAGGGGARRVCVRGAACRARGAALGTSVEGWLAVRRRAAAGRRRGPCGLHARSGSRQ